MSVPLGNQPQVVVAPGVRRAVPLSADRQGTDLLVRLAGFRGIAGNRAGSGEQVEDARVRIADIAQAKAILSELVGQHGHRPLAIGDRRPPVAALRSDCPRERQALPSLWPDEGSLTKGHQIIECRLGPGAISHGHVRPPQSWQ